MDTPMYDLQDTAYLFVYKVDADKTDSLIRASVERYRRVRLEARDSSPLIIERTAKGKPYLKGQEGIGVSVTHSGAYCIIGVACCEIGIDLQSHDRLRNENAAKARERYIKLSKRFFCPDEDAYVSLAPDTRFFEVWCAKESYVKYTGSGIDDSFRTVSVLPAGKIDRLDTWNAADARFQIVAFDTGYTLCVCTAQPCEVRLVGCEASA